MLAVMSAIALAANAPLHLSELLQQARQRNAQLQAARQQVRAASQAVAPAGALPDPILSAELMDAPVDFASVPLKLQLTQLLPLGGKRALRTQAARDELGIRQAELEAQTRDVEAQVKRAYFALFVAQRTAEIDAAIGRTLAALHQAALTRIASGRGEQVEALRWEGAQLENEADQASAAQQADTARASLSALLDRPPEALQGPTATPSVLRALPPQASLWETALRVRPELLAAAQAVAQAQTRVRLARAQKVPDLGVFVGEKHAFGAPGNTDFLTLGARINLPVFSGSKNDPEIAAAKARAEAARANERWVRDRIRAAIWDAYARVRADERIVAVHRQLLPISHEALQSAQASYVAGRTDYLVVLDALAAWQRDQLRLAQSLGRYEQHLAELEHAVGSELGLLAAAEGEGHARP